MAKAQPSDNNLQTLQTANNSIKFARIPFPMCTDTLLCHISTGTFCPYVPEQFRHKVFDSLHSLSHPGIRSTLRLVKERYFWPQTSSSGHVLACSARRLRSTVTLPHR